MTDGRGPEEFEPELPRPAPVHRFAQARGPTRAAPGRFSQLCAIEGAGHDRAPGFCRLVCERSPAVLRPERSTAAIHSANSSSFARSPATLQIIHSGPIRLARRTPGRRMS